MKCTDRLFEKQVGIDSVDDIEGGAEILITECRSGHKRLPDENEGSDVCAAMQRERCRHVGGRSIDVRRECRSVTGSRQDSICAAKRLIDGMSQDILQSQMD